MDKNTGGIRMIVGIASDVIAAVAQQHGFVRVSC
jgi:hypothetical protein